MDNFDEKIRIIKIYRSPECYLDDLIIDIKEFYIDIYPDNIFYIKNDIILFRYDIKLKDFDISNDILDILLYKYHCDSTKIFFLLTNLIKNNIIFINAINKTSLAASDLAFNQLIYNEKYK